MSVLHSKTSFSLNEDFSGDYLSEVSAMQFKI